jgi:hypothetical protein
MSDQTRESVVRAPTLAETISGALGAFGRRLPVSMPAKVSKVNTSKRSVDCKILVQRPFFDEEDARQVESIPIIPGVPLAFPPYFTGPISDGTLVFGGQTRPATTGLLVFCDRSLDKWLSGTGQEVDPQIDHDHALADAVFFPMIFPFGAVPFALPQDAITIGDANGNDFVALAQKVLTELNAIKTAFNSHTHAAGSLAAPSGGGAVTGVSAGPSASYSPNSVAASEVKAK